MGHPIQEFGYNRSKSAMAVTVGTQLGSLEITSLLGKGGMGEVYRARDAKLKRDVAVKILPDEFASSPDRVSRFQREAEVLALLNHPNIAAIYDLQQADDLRFLVLELVEGETLADRLRLGPLEPGETLQIARQLCEALEAAHEKGVVHRDLKPANVKITPDGNVKVLDFGLAKAFEGSSSAAIMSNSPTLTQAGTASGVILGTAAYMSPEQARGRAADHRSDVFSFGCVVYEMLAGSQAFEGEDVSDVLASVLKNEPDFSLLPKINPRIRELLRRCLQKNPKLRWQAIGDVRFEIDAAISDPSGVTAESTATPVARSIWRRAFGVLAPAVLAAALAGYVAWTLKPPPAVPVTKFALSLGEGQQITTTRFYRVLAVSPDGAQIVYEANRQLYHRSISEPEARPISGTGTTGFIVNPVFSPDGRSIAFFTSADFAVKKVPLSGGTPVTIIQSSSLFGFSWTNDGFLTGGRNGIQRVSSNGGTPETLIPIKSGEVASNPEMLPGGRAVLFTLAKGNGQTTEQWDSGQIVVHSLQSGERKALIEGGFDARYVPGGQIVYASRGILFAVPFDAKRLELTGASVPVIEGVRRGTVGTAHYALSDNGTLIYLPGPISSTIGEQQVPALMDRKGVVQPRKVPPQQIRYPRFSPDGARIAFEAGEPDRPNIWIYELNGNAAPRQLTVGGANRFPVWAGNGERLAFQSDREGDLGIFWQRADGAGPAERLTKPQEGASHIPDSWSTDGYLSFTEVKGSEAAVWIFSVHEKKASLVKRGPSMSVARSAFSPDGRWIAYQSNDGGANRLWVQPFPPTGAEYPLVNGGQPFWSANGKELFYNAGPGGLISMVSITTRPTFAFSDSVVVPNKGLTGLNPSTFPRNIDISADGQRFVGVVSADQTQSPNSSAPPIQVVLNWLEELKKRLASK